MKALKTLLLAVIMVGLGACAEKRGPEPSTAAPQTPPSDKHQAIQLRPSGALGRQEGGGGGGARTALVADAEGLSGQEAFQPQIDRKIIRNATLVIETDDPAAAQRKVGAIAETNGGFVVTSEFKTSASQLDAVTVNVILRVPASVFEATITAVRAAGGKVLEENVSGKDVTEEYIDLEARLKTKKALEAQFLEIMKQARKVSDALEVQTEIANVRTEIEQIEGRRRFLENQSSLSTITVTFSTPAPVVTATATGFGHSVKEAFGEGADLAVAIVLGLIRIVIVMIPVVVLILLPIGWLGRYLLRKYHRPKPAEPIPQA
jgi:hypothetical protein